MTWIWQSVAQVRLPATLAIAMTAHRTRYRSSCTLPLTAKKMSTVHVDFDFFAPKPDDYHATKRFLTVLLSTDAEKIPLIDVAESILAQSHVGTMVKVDGEEGDPYAILTILPMSVRWPDSKQSLMRRMRRIGPRP